MYGARIRSEAGQGRGDDTAVNSLDFRCQWPIENRLQGSGLPWGDFETDGAYAECPRG